MDGEGVTLTASGSAEVRRDAESVERDAEDAALGTEPVFSG